MKAFQHCFVPANHPFMSLLVARDCIRCMKLQKNIDQSLERHIVKISFGNMTRYSILMVSLAVLPFVLWSL